MDQRGQISVEFILIAAIIILVVIAFGLVIADQTEKNAVSTAVKMGAENGTTYSSILNQTMQPVRVTKIEMTGTNNINIKVYFSSNVTSIQQSILNSINKSLSQNGYKPAYSGGSPLVLQTNRHTYTITLS